MTVTAKTPVRVRSGGRVIVSRATLGDVLTFRGTGSQARKKIFAELADAGFTCLPGTAYAIEVIA